MRTPSHPVSMLHRALLLAATAACSPAGADVVHRTIALSGTSAGPNLVYDTFDNATINSSGKVLFWARLAATNPANDECAGAIDIPTGGTFVSTVGATHGAISVCSSTRPDVWFRYTSPVAASMTFGVLGMNYVASLGIFRGTCGSLTSASPCVLIGESSPITMAAGETIYLLLGADFNAPASMPTGTCIITIRPAPGGQPPPAPVTLSTTDAAIFSDRSGALAMLLREGAPAAFDPTLVHAALPLPAFNDSGMFALTGGVFTPPAPTSQQPISAMFTNDSAGATVLIETEVLPPPPAVPDWFLPPPKLFASGEVAYARLDGSTLRYGAATIASGSPAPGTPAGVNFLFLDQPVVGAGASAVAFRSTLQAAGGVDETNNSGVWTDFDGPLSIPPELVARTGSPAPGTPAGVNFSRLAIEPGITPDGRLVLWASLTGPGIDTTNNTGLWTNRAGTVALLARAGDVAPLSPAGSVFQSFSKRPAINSARTIAALAYISGPSVTAETNSGIWLYPLGGGGGGAPYAIAREGSSASGLPEGVAFASFSDPVLNDQGDIAFVAHLRGPGVTPASNVALCLFRAGSTTAIVSTGDAFAVSPTEMRTVRDIDFGTLPPSSGRAQLSESGTLVFRLSFTDDSSGLFAADRTCDADFNHDGTVNSSDFFDFLTLFLAGDPAADFNHSGAVTSQDFFDFLGAFFAGC